jgi:predicted transcriptional regulator
VNQETEDIKNRPIKKGIIEEDGVLYVSGDEYVIRVASALANTTRLEILKKVREKEIDVGELAELIGQSKANASAQIKKLEEAELIRTKYVPGERGVKKMCHSTIRKIVLFLE